MKGLYIVPVDVNSHFFDKGGSTTKLSSSSSDAMSPFMEEFYLSLAPLFLFETGQSNYTDINLAEEVEIRNGRWTQEEIQFIECLISLFKEGNLPISTGITLNNFLRSIFLCKSTRLRKKIKNANFCTSTFLLRTNEKQQASAKELSKLQERFLDSLDDKKSRSLLRLGMRRMWSTYFFNLCMHLGYEGVLAQDWLNSLEKVEEKIKSAKESKKLRERRSRSTGAGYGNVKYPGLDGSNENHLHINMNRSSNSLQQMFLDPLNQSYHQPLNLHASNHSHHQLNLDSSNHSHGSNLLHPSARKSNLSFALDKAQINPQVGIKRPCTQNTSTSNQGKDLDVSNHSLGLGGLLVSSYPHRPMMTPIPPRHHGSLPNNFQWKPRDTSPPKTLLSSGRNPPNGFNSLWGKGISRQPEIVPLEINGDREDSGNLSDVSDSESNTIVADLSTMDEMITEGSRSCKRARVADAVPKKEQGKGAMPFLDDVIEEVSTEDLCDVADICEQFGDWSPFVKKMSTFVENEDLPFEYFDVWKVSEKKTDKEKSDEDGNTHDLTKGSPSDLVLRHVGHSARSDGSIWTLYHMNEFGKLR